MYYVGTHSIQAVHVQDLLDLHNTVYVYSMYVCIIYYSYKVVMKDLSLKLNPQETYSYGASKAAVIMLTRRMALTSMAPAPAASATAEPTMPAKIILVRMLACA